MARSSVSPRRRVWASGASDSAAVRSVSATIGRPLFPKDSLRNACVPNLVSVPSLASERNRTLPKGEPAHDGLAVGEVATTRGGSPRRSPCAHAHCDRRVTAHGGAGRDHREHRPSAHPERAALFDHQPLLGPQRLHTLTFGGLLLLG